MNCLTLVVLLKFTLGIFAWDIVHSNQTEDHQYLNLVRCLAANEPTSNTTVGLDSNGILSFNIITSDTNHSDYVYNRCWNENANSTLTHFVINGSQNETFTNATHVSKVQDGHEMFGISRNPIPINDVAKNNLTKRQKYSNYYSMLVSEDKDTSCINNEQIDTVTDVCQDDQLVSLHSFNGINPNAGSLRLTVWPHHSCNKGDYESYTITPGSYTGCIKKTIFSWWGTLFEDECYNMQKACMNTYLEHWDGKYHPGQTIHGVGKHFGHYP
ncbi:putative secreted protein [Wickerhamomyces ciferrii]|uniref:Secreted protein n=1 Tax=Wickerhamomyces ciferrii (strain ATCC 14091 / BCRC 22168 / CBS 111 / JCM 3599 / NBRC 0793 / NRRL Y-1031 F-60-10) TaxID=1206466 RepID=K0KWX3_WICCF|nr:uncharacterized protein BN7_5181 [Wickerhamomyces ciferrii]CCH45598.1 putative secreted protein [Wickerhamomyces ciferrii]